MAVLPTSDGDGSTDFGKCFEESEAAKSRHDCKISAVFTYSLGDPATPTLDLLPHQSSSQPVSPSTES